MRKDSPASPQIESELARFRNFRAQLLAAMPDLDEETLGDTLEGISDLHEMLAELLRSALVDEALVAGLSKRLADMNVRHDRLALRAKRKRQLALRVMTDADITRITVADFTASLKKSAPMVEIVDEAAIASDYWLPQPPRLDRQGLLAALKAGVSVAGAQLAEGRPQLSIRTK